MLYLNSFENAAAIKTEEGYVISPMPNITELVPSKELLAQWQSKKISWEEFREGFIEEMQAEFKGDKSRLKGLAKHSLENDVTLLSPEPSGEQTYRAILEEIINKIWKKEGRTDHVINLAQEPSELQKEIAEKDEKIKSLQTENRNKDIENDKLNEQINQLQEQINTYAESIKSRDRIILTKDDEVKSLQAKSHNKDTENDKLKKQTDQLQEQIDTHTESIKSLSEMLSAKEEEIQSLQAESHNKDTENDELKAETDHLQEQINTHTESIKSQDEIISTKDDEIKSLKAKSRKKESDIAQLQEQINNDQKIRDIAVEAIGDDKLEKYFRNLKIDENLPVELCKWLEGRLKKVLDSSDTLYKLIQHCITDQILDSDDAGFAHSIRKQRNLFSHDSPIDEKTKMGRVLYCFFAEALVFPKLPEIE